MREQTQPPHLLSNDFAKPRVVVGVAVLGFGHRALALEALRQRSEGVRYA